MILFLDLEQSFPLEAIERTKYFFLWKLFLPTICSQKVCGKIRRRHRNRKSASNDKPDENIFCNNRPRLSKVILIFAHISQRHKYAPTPLLYTIIVNMAMAVLTGIN